MSRVLWICNIMLPAIGQELNLPYSNREGWLSGIFERVCSENPPFTLGVCFPAQETLSLTVRGIECYGFRENLNAPENYDEGLEEEFRRIFEAFKPDMIHIFGTEFPHALASIRVFCNPKKTLIGIQGLCGEIGKVYMADLPEKVQNRVTFRDWLKKDSIRQQQEKFLRRGENEAQAILRCGNITGRTRFDREGTARINPHALYYPMNETMRKEFYAGEWNLGECEEHSIFLGQGDYPLKGMHFVLEALALLLPKYPDARLYVAGNSVIEHRTFKEKLKLSAYGKYLLSLIREHKLEKHVVMTGKLNAEEMKQRFLKCSVFVCASVLENSPNTVGEAQLLGVPVVASMAGGIPDMIADGRDGLLFQTGNVQALANQIEALWDRSKGADGLCLAERISNEARKRARMTHDSENNYLRLLEIYRAIEESK